jgi:hypothetical protein
MCGIRWLTAATLLFSIFATNLAAQGAASARVTGQVRDESGGPLSGVQVVIVNQATGYQNGALTQDNGRYLVMGLRPGGPYRIEARMIGYGLEMVENVRLEPGSTYEANFTLGSEAIAMDALEVFATRAIERETPVAYSDVPKVQIQNQLGSRDLPLVLNVTPSVYATQQGGGAGDARINVRGFSQRNTAVMINGVPVNDMENGWVYWSNWDGLGDAATSIQLQRGLSAVNLATPSIGGTLNVITDPSATAAGVTYKQEFGSGDFLKETLVFSTGQFKDKFAITGSVVRKTGDGLFTGGLGGDSNWTDAWAYYFAGSYQINPRNRLELYAVGAPQRHGQNLYKLNIGTLDPEFARDLDSYDEAALDDFPEAGRLWGPNVNVVNAFYKGKQYTSTGPGAGTFDRYDQHYLNERENYYHKPQVNLNWYSYFGGGLSLFTVAYYSGGSGGGTGTWGSMEWDYRYGQRFVDWNATIEENQSNDGGISSGILRNSVNNQWTIGAISKLKKEFDNGFTAEVGVDWRTAEIEHYREVRDLLGGEAYDDCHPYYGCSSDFWTGNENLRGLGDRIAYNNQNQVDWIGGFIQGEHVTPEGSFYAMVGANQNSYHFTDFFTDDPEQEGLQHLELESGALTGYQIKGGANRNLTDQISVFANAGYVSKVPIFDGVIDDGAGVKNPDPKNEKFLSFEGGMNFRSLDRAVTFDISFYHTTWKDRTYNLFVRNLEGDNQDGLVNLLGVDARHMGIEAQGAYQPNEYFRFDAAASIGSWKYLDDVTGTYRPDEGSADVETFEFYIEDLKVSDAPQTQFAYSGSVFPIQGLMLQAVGKTYMNHYAAFEPFDRTDEAEKGIQPWKVPGYTVFDLHASYRLGEVIPVWKGGNVRLFANVFNVFNSVYVQDAVDNSRYNSYDDDHDADDAEVFLGLPRFINLGFEVGF